MKLKISVIITTLVSLIVFISCNRNIDKNSIDKGSADIFPDYTEITIPMNIAPLNFLIRESGKKYQVNFISENKEYSFRITSKDSIINIPQKKWKKLMESSIDQSYQVYINIKKMKGNWISMNPITNKVSSRIIDPYITYRRINPGLIFWENMAIVQRSLEDYSESDIISNQNSEKNCMHCHTFRDRDPETFMLHARSTPSGTLIKTNDKTLWLNTKTPYTLSGFVYPSWHPSGRYIAYSTNKIHQNFFGSGDRINHVRDKASDLIIYDIETNMVFTSPEIATADFENIPAWAPEGDYLYFIRSPHRFKYLPDSAEKYDLLRIHFNPGTQELGTAETILKTEETGLSISFPQVSPNGKYLIFCMADYGYFNINNTSSDLYLMDIETKEYNKLAVNSEKTESWPSWSDNSSWIMFTSKRIDGMLTVPHFSFVDSLGVAHKPFPLPFKNPESYFSRITNINRPVFVKGKVNFSEDELQQIIHSPTQDVVFDSLGVDLDALSGATANDEALPATSVPYMRD